MDTTQRHRPVCKVKLGYEFTYLYAALVPGSGALIALLLPDMTGDSFSVFFHFFEMQVQQLYTHGKILLIPDQAAAHWYKAAKNSRVVLYYLPVASPELNCVWNDSLKKSENH